MARFSMCGLVWSATVRTPLSSPGLTRLPSTSPTGAQTSQSSPLRKPVVCSTLERCVCPFASSLFVLGVCWKARHRACPCEPCNIVTRVHLQTHGWKIGQCTTKLPFICQREGVINESSPSGCLAVSIFQIEVFLKGRLCFQHILLIVMKPRI